MSNQTPIMKHSVEVRGRYDGVAYRVGEDDKRYSREAKIPIEDDELCKYGKIYKVVATGEYDYKILGEREDK